MTATPQLLETYQEARLLFEAKGWGLAKAAEHLSEMRELARFHISHPKLSKKTALGASAAIEPEVAAAVESLKTWVGCERQAEIVTAGLRAVHGAPPIADPSARQRAFRFLRKLAERFGRLSWRPVAITAASGALVGCLVLVLLTPQPGPPMLIVPDAGPNGALVQFDPRGLFDKMPARWGEKPLDQPIPVKTLPGQQVAPCDTALGEVAINGNCWAAQARVKPPCGVLFRHENECYRPIAAEPKKPAP